MRDHLSDAAWFAIIVLEWVVIAAVMGLLVWTLLAWLIPPGDCTGITCW